MDELSLTSQARRLPWLGSARLWTAVAAGLIALIALLEVTITGPRVTVLWRANIAPADRLARTFEHADQLVLVCLAVTAANAAICYAYTKDEIMSTAGVFYALAVFAAVRTVLARFAAVPRSVFASVAVSVLLLVSSATWAVRATGLHYYMYYSGYYLRNEWATVEVWLREQRVEPTEEGTRLVETLRSAAIEMPTLNPYFLPRWAERWFE